MSRPKAEIDWEKVNNYLKAQCDGAAIARLLGIHPDTLYLRCQAEFNMGFSEYSQQKKAEGVEMLKMKMYADAVNGNTSMQIWLSKQYAGFKDKQDITSNNDSIIMPIIKIERS
jgi:hypothetical protein